MKFNVAQLLKSSIGTSREYTIDEQIGAIDGVPTASALTGHAKLTRTPSGVLVDAQIDVAVVLACSRCLEEVKYPLHLTFTEEFQPTIDVTTGAELPGPRDESVFTIDASHILDLSEAIREYAVVAMPMQALCSEECKGLCPVCGKNLNRDQCTCSTTPTDSRLAKLAELLEREEEKKE